MPPRLARSSVSTAAPKSAKQKNKKRNLNAYSIASHSTASKKQPLKSHRLGEYLDDRPAPKRRRDSDDDDVEALDDEDLRGAANKRRKATLEDDDVEEGSDSEGNEWTLGGLRDGDSDSDLDSEEAFGESDEERFEGFTFGGSSGKKPVKKSGKARKGGDGDEMDLEKDGQDGDEEGSEGEQDLWANGVDLATMLDDDDGEDDADEEEGSGSDEEDGKSDSESESDGDDEDAGNDEERNASMRDRLEALDGDQQVAKPKQSGGQNTLSVDDLLADLDPSAKKQFAAATKTKKRSERPTTLAAPLPKRQQDRLNREVASQKAKEQLDRWRDTVIQNRRAEFLSFPLKNPDEGEPLGKDKFLESKPQNELEANIQRIMEESGMGAKDGAEAEDEEDAIMKAEGMAEQKMDVDDVMRRRAELRKMRELLFYEERKAKRISKIKSKSYRRVHRREKAREAERTREERAELGLDPMDEDGRGKQDRQRAEQRMGTKHRDSKWAKQLKQTNRATWDEGARDSVNEEARRREELRRRVEGKYVESDDESDQFYEDEDDDGDAAVTFRQLEGLKQGVDDSGSKLKGVAGMKFMRDADARRKAQNDEDVERMRKEMSIEDGDEGESEGEVDDQGLGRAIFGPQGSQKQQPKKVKKSEMEEGSESEGGEGGDQEDEVEIVTEGKGASAKKQGQGTANGGGKSGLLARSSGISRKDPYESTAGEGEGDGTWFSKGKKSTLNSDSDDEDIRLPPQATQPTTSEEQLRVKATRPDAPAFLQDLHAQIAASKSSQSVPKKAAAPVPNGTTLVKYATEQDSASDSDPEPANPNQAFRKLAFAGDDVEAHFAAEKAAQEASEDEQEEPSNHLPGWGSWTGANLPKKIKKSNAAAKAKAKQPHHPLFKTKSAPAQAGVKPSERKDAQMPNVIVSEKGDRKGKKFLATQLPRGFQGQQEYERSLRLPVGEEWGTKEVVQRNTRPRVVVQKGRVVEAMERPRV